MENPRHRRRAATLGLTLLGLVLVGHSALTTQAQDGRVPSVLEGTWRRAIGAERARQVVAAAFEPRLARFPAMLRGIARDRITESLPMPDRVAVALGERVRVTYLYEDRRLRVDTALGGTTRVRDVDGETRRVSQRLQRGWLEQVFRGADGDVHRLLSTEPDGATMHLDYTVHNERLGEAVRWRVDYRR